MCVWRFCADEEDRKMAVSLTMQQPETACMCSRRFYADEEGRKMGRKTEKYEEEKKPPPKRSACSGAFEGASRYPFNLKRHGT